MSETLSESGAEAAFLTMDGVAFRDLNKNGRMDPYEDPRRPLEERVDPEVAGDYGQVVSGVKDADVAIIRLNTPFEPREGFLERLFHSGPLAFPEAEKERILEIVRQVPTIVGIYLERPAVIPEIAQECAGLLADFGASDAAVLDVIFGRFNPSAKLPFELPSLMDAVVRQKEDVPYDSQDPLYPFGYGLSYEGPPRP